MQVLRYKFEEFSMKNSDSKIARIVTYILGESFKEIKGILDFNKVSRDDVTEYKIKFLQRQQVINEKLVSFGLINKGDNVLDACCGPEGSSLAVLNKGANWYGNEISKKTFEHLLKIGLNVKNGTAEKLQFTNNEFDYVIYCYAINNIQATLKTLKEGNRVLKNKGKILIADPGITVWLSDIILYSIKNGVNNNSLNLDELISKSERFRTKIPGYLKSKDLNIDQYTDFLINGLLGINKDVLINNFSEVINYLDNRYKNKKINIHKISNYFNKYINSFYWENILKSSEILNMDLEKCSFYNCIKRIEEKDWSFTESVQISFKGKNSLEIRDIFMKLQLPNEEYSETLLIGKKGIQNLLPTIMFSFKKSSS